MNVPPPQPHPPRAYPSGKHPDLPPPIATSDILGWRRQNLFSSLFNTSLTLIAVSLLYLFVSGVGGWMVFDSVVTADSRAACQAIDSGACWAVVTTRLDQFIYGFYPPRERWRPNVAFILLFVALTLILFSAVPLRRPLLWFAAAFPFIAGWLICGGFGLPIIDTGQYSGFMLTSIIGVTGISASLPLGILLALGRQSKLIALRVISTAFIESSRGVPLITLLFVASTMLNYFLPPGTSFDLLVRVLIMVSLFAAAYLAEAIRGGLQAIPRGQ